MANQPLSQWHAATVIRLPAASRAVVALYRPHLAPLQLTHPQYLAMLTLADQRPHAVTEIAHRLFLTPGTVSPLLARLEALGYIDREHDTADNRRLGVTLTGTGIALVPRLEDIVDAVRNQIGISLQDRTLLRRFIKP